MKSPKDWLIDNEEDLAMEMFDTEYYELNEKQLIELLKEADKRYGDYKGGCIDYITDQLIDDAKCEAQLKGER